MAATAFQLPMVVEPAMDVDTPVASGSSLSAFPRPSLFHPASFSRQFLGSPISWRAGSFGSRFYPAGSPGQLLAPFDTADAKLERVSSSVESDRHMIQSAIQAIEQADEQCRNYTCCGLQLNDLHALVDHFEDRHVLVVDPNAAPASPSFGPSGAFDVDDMELDDGGSSGASTPPPATPLSPRSSPPPGSVFDTSLVRSAYATYGEFNTSLSAGSTPPPEEGRLNAPGCVPPAVLFSPGGSPSGSRTGSPVPRASAAAGPSTEKPAKAAVPRASTTVARPATTLLLSKPFKCPKPNCNKSYKQANGLKYHITHGSCSFAPAKEVTEVNAVLAQRGRAALPADMSASELDLAALGVSEPEAREIEREAERRLKPFACGIADCTRRYKNMNGLRYHYQHSGDHGAIGLALLASGQHECLRNGPHKAGRASSMQHSLSTSSTAASTSTPTTTPASLVPAAMPSIQTAYAAVAAAAASRPYQQYSSPGQVQVPTAQPTSLATHPLLTAYTTGIYAQQQPQLAAPSAAHLA